MMVGTKARSREVTESRGGGSGAGLADGGEWTPRKALWWYCQGDEPLFVAMVSVWIGDETVKDAAKATGVSREKLSKHLERFHVLATGKKKGGG